MFFLIGKNHPYYDDLNKNTNQNCINKQIEALEIQLKKKFERVQDFNPEDCYNHSQNSDEEDLENSGISSVESDRNRDNKEEGLPRKHTYDIFGPSSQGLSKKMYYINEKKSFYRRLIKLFDILAVILILLGTILSQYEHELYYYDNIFYRVTAVVMINYAYNNPYNHSMKYMFDDNLISLSDLTKNTNTFLENENENTEISQNFNNFNQNYINTNSYFISHLNISKFKYIDNLTSYENIQVPLKISEPSKNIRVILLFTTILSCFLVTMSRYFDHVREYFYKKEQDLSFYKSEYCFFAILENLVILPVQYPGVNGYIIFTQLGSTICLPITSLLASISIFRFIFIYKFLRHFSVWNSEMAEKKCERYVCQADTKFAFKAIQKEFPFLTLVIIFILTCVCFGFSLRNFELHYWEAQSGLFQNWRYHWNAMWCVFVSMTTVGFGDFYPKTHPGRFIIIIACVVGIYFVSMMMVFMTQKSILNESEQKAYKLITRLKLRNEIKNTQSNIVSHFLQMVLIKKKKSKSLLNDKEYEIRLNYERRSIISYIEIKKYKEKCIKHFEFIPTKEQLFDICARIDTDIKEIKQEINSLIYLNDSIIAYTESQVDMVKYIKKNIYATKLMYEIIDKKSKVFGQLANFDRTYLKDDGRFSLGGNDQIAENQIDINDLNKNNNFVILYNNEQKKTISDKLETPDNINEVSIMNRTRNIEESLHPNSNPNSNNNNINSQINDFSNIINPNQFDENISKVNLPPLNLKNTKYYSDEEFDNEYYADELNNYNVTPEEIKEHFNFLFFNKNDSSKKIIKKNTYKTIMTIKNMKKNQSKLKYHINLKKNAKTPRKRTTKNLGLIIN